MAVTLESGRIVAGVWEAELSGVTPAFEVAVMTGGRAVDGVEVTPGKDGRCTVRMPIPAWAVNDGVQVFLVQSGGVTLGTFTLAAGEPVDHDLRAEVALLRAEIDLLKRAFQRHVRES